MIMYTLHTILYIENRVQRLIQRGKFCHTSMCSFMCRLLSVRLCLRNKSCCSFSNYSEAYSETHRSNELRFVPILKDIKWPSLCHLHSEFCSESVQYLVVFSFSFLQTVPFFFFEEPNCIQDIRNCSRMDGYFQMIMSIHYNYFSMPGDKPNKSFPE